MAASSQRRDHSQEQHSLQHHRRYQHHGRQQRASRDTSSDSSSALMSSRRDPLRLPLQPTPCPPRGSSTAPSHTRPQYMSCREHFYAHVDQEARWAAQGRPSALSAQVSESLPSSEDYHSQDLQLSSQSPLARDLDSHHDSPTSRFLCLTATPQPAYVMSSNESPFLRLPTELRLRIYALLVLPRRENELIPSYERVSRSVRDSFDYDRRQQGTDRLATADLVRPTLLIRTIEPTSYATRHAAMGPLRRTTYAVRGDRFRARTMTTTYHCVNVPRLEHNMGIMAVNKQIHAEAAEMLYGGYTFDFDTHVEAVVPFLADLTPFARSCIRSIRVVKRALAYERDADRCEWSSAMRYLTAAATGLSLRRLDLGIVAGRPGPNGWDRIARYSAGDFGLLKDLEGMEWMQYLLDFRGLEELHVSAVVDHCPPGSTSLAMAGFIRFSASVESGFREFLTKELLSHKTVAVTAA